MPAVTILLADGFETVEATAPADVLRRVGVRTRLVSATGTYQVVSAQQVQVSADDLIETFDFDRCDCLVLPGGIVATRQLHADERVRILLRRFVESRMLASSGLGPNVLSNLGLLVNRHATVLRGYEGAIIPASYVNRDVVRDRNLLTCRSLGAILEYSAELVDMVAGPDAFRRVREELCLPASPAPRGEECPSASAVGDADGRHAPGIVEAEGGVEP
ncbi:MAG: DJ-1/PfpI family protein [Coriobacteriales bacterium]|jgi:4-methyl-5(b-hydroxyethyl)-thiazole monophosphate biosynthesis